MRRVASVYLPKWPLQRLVRARPGLRDELLVLVDPTPRGPQVVLCSQNAARLGVRAGMPLAERLLEALAAGQATGGDKRWGLFQSAALRIADPNHPGRGGDHVSIAIDVGEPDADESPE